MSVEMEWERFGNAGSMMWCQTEATKETTAKCAFRTLEGKLQDDKSEGKVLREEGGVCLPQGASLRVACTAAEQYLAARGIEDAAVDAWYLLEYVTGVSRARYLADRDKSMKEEQRDAYAALVTQRGAHIPLQHLTGEQEFMGLPFLVSEAVLIPRQDTETLVELALEKIKASLRSDAVPGKNKAGQNADLPREEKDRYRVLDLCTGSGCIAVSIAKLCERMPEVCASDLSADALAVARENARRLGVDVRFFQSDLFTQITKPAEGFDLIVSNPPYIRTRVIEELSEEVRLHEPRMALDGGMDGLEFYRRIVCESRDYLRSGGWLLLEIGYDQGTEVADLLRRYGFSQVRVSKDLAGNDRVAEGIYDA
ncbi:MAG: peptide chain release factor N(5)-glutamine methyltransferase [Lachnospiraceae bacterium]|nr:peptide chain release factor N(5)-glutamine methyltransferase [Lachnospiraceae bacterium]